MTSSTSRSPTLGRMCYGPLYPTCGKKSSMREERFDLHHGGILLVREGALSGVVLADGEILHAEHLILAIGHSSRDTFRTLRTEVFPWSQSPFPWG